MRNLKIHSLPSAKEWVDRDEIMLHACFQILVDFIDKEHGDTHKLDTISARTENELNDKMNWEEYDDNNNNIELILICGTIILFFMLLFWTINKLN